MMKAKNAAAFVHSVEQELRESPNLGRNLDECLYQYLYLRCGSIPRNRWRSKF
jgi:hypothetical protein